MPTWRAPIRPGPLVMAKASTSSNLISAFSTASFKTRAMFSQCNLEAISGMTPPYFWCTSICVLITLESSLPSLVIATLVSSQLDSIANINAMLFHLQNHIISIFTIIVIMGLNCFYFKSLFFIEVNCGLITHSNF